MPHFSKISYLSIGILLLAFPFASCQRTSFQPAYGVCAKISDYPVLAADGYDYVEENVINFLVPDKSDSAFQVNLERQQKTGAKILSYIVFLPTQLKSVGFDTNHEEIISWSEIAFRRAQATGAKYIVWGMSGGSCRVPEGFDKQKALSQVIDICKQMGPIAQKYGITLLIEPINSEEVKDKFVNTLGEGAHIVQAVNHPNVQLLCDVYHMMRENESAEEIIKHGKYIRHCHISEKETRSAPGVMKDNFVPYLKALKKIGYHGGISVECTWTDFAAQHAPALQYLKEQSRNL